MRGQGETIRQYLKSIGKNPDEFINANDLAKMLKTSWQKAYWLVNSGWLESVVDVEKGQNTSPDSLRNRKFVDRNEVISIQRGYHKNSVRIAEFVSSDRAGGKPLGIGGWLDGKGKVTEKQKEESETSPN